MENFIIVVIVAAVIGSALWYIRREKRRGRKCVGCPCAGNCPCSCK